MTKQIYEWCVRVCWLTIWCIPRGVNKHLRAENREMIARKQHIKADERNYALMIGERLRAFRDNKTRNASLPTATTLLVSSNRYYHDFSDTVMIFLDNSVVLFKRRLSVLRMKSCCSWTQSLRWSFNHSFELWEKNSFFLFSRPQWLIAICIVCKFFSSNH